MMGSRDQLFTEWTKPFNHIKKSIHAVVANNSKLYLSQATAVTERGYFLSLAPPSWPH